jgi:phosphate transport system permease protein
MNSKQYSRGKLTDKVFKYIALAFTVFALSILVILLIDIFSKGVARINWDFFRNLPSRHADRSGIMTAMAGMLSLLFFTIIIALPIGIMAGVYLQEYGKKSRFASFIEINIANLAGVPSVIYGILGLTLFVRILHMGNSLIAGALTLALLIMPIIIVATREAIKAVPNSLREASYGDGCHQMANNEQGGYSICFRRYINGYHTGHIKSHWRNCSSSCHWCTGVCSVYTGRTE